MNKRLSAILAVLLVLSLVLTACQSTGGGGAATTAATGASATTTPKGSSTAGPGTTAATEKKENFNEVGYPIVDEPITITMGFFGVAGSAYPYPPRTPSDTHYYQAVTKYTNIQFDWVLVDDSSAENVNLFFATGDFPDVFLNGLNNTRVMEHGVIGGVFEDISELIPQYMPIMVSRFADYPMMEKVMYELDGSVYTFPGVRLGSTAASGQLYYRTDYVEAVGEVPKTLDEFYDIVTKIKEADLCGGYAPICPSLGAPGGFMGFLMGAFGDSVDFPYTDDGTGKVECVFISEQYRRMIDFVRMLYAEGLLEPEIYTLDEASKIARVNAGQVAFGNQFSGLLPEHFPDNEIHISMLSPLTSEYTSTPKVPGYNYASAVAGGIKKGTPYVREILRVFDIMYAKEEIIPGSGLDSNAFNTGIKGLSYETYDDGTYKFLIPDDWKTSQWDYVRQYFGINSTVGIYDFMYLSKTPNANARERGMVYNNIPYAVDQFPLNTMKLTADESQKISTANTDISAYRDQMIAKFVTGVEPMSKWEDYVNEIKKMGLDGIISVYQDAYDRWNSAGATSFDTSKNIK